MQNSHNSNAQEHFWFYGIISLLRIMIIIFFWKIQLTIFISDVSHPIRMFSQTVLAADPGLDTMTSSFLMTPSGSANHKGDWVDGPPLICMIVDVLFPPWWRHSVKTRISCQHSLRKHSDRMWNITNRNSKENFSKEHYFNFYWILTNRFNDLLRIDIQVMRGTVAQW